VPAKPAGAPELGAELSAAPAVTAAGIAAAGAQARAPEGEKQSAAPVVIAAGIAAAGT
jgi:hypothetical protein